jgi:hypothetical protein
MVSPSRDDPQVVCVTPTNESKLQFKYRASLDRFCAHLGPGDADAITTALDEIMQLRRNMIVNALVIGKCLSGLRSKIGPRTFSQFMRQLLPNVGISRSTGYRWLAYAEGLAVIFPNPLIREGLMALTDGKGIVTTSRRGGYDGLPNLTLTLAAQAALKTVPPAPGLDCGREGSERWIRHFIEATAKARSDLRASRASLVKEQTALIERFKRFVACHGCRAGEDLCGALDKILNRLVEDGC